MPSLYRRILGPKLDWLPDNLRRFHDRVCGEAAGAVQVTRGQGCLCNWLADILGLPAPGRDVPVSVRFHKTAKGEHWCREFGSNRLVSEQWQDGELLIESVGPMRLGFRLVASEEGIEFQHVRSWLWRLPLGRLFRVHAIALGEAEGWQIRVQVKTCRGLLIHYEGKVVGR